MNLFYLRYFVTLAHVKHYTKAAEQLCITQPSLSHAIAQMEKELGVPLFEKNGRNTMLTPFGREFLSCAEHTLSTLDDGIASLQRSARGSGLIRLGFVRPLGIEFVPHLAADFLRAYPENDIRFTFHTGITQHLLDDLAQRKVDLLFCSKPQDDLKFTAVPVQSWLSSCRRITRLPHVPLRTVYVFPTPLHTRTFILQRLRVSAVSLTICSTGKM